MRPDLPTLHATAAAEHMAGTEAAFARFVGWHKGHITRLKQCGQIVLQADGQVDFAASLQRIIGQADPSRDAQRERAAALRQPVAHPAAPPLDDRQGDETPEQSDAMAYATARARKEHWQAEQARIDYERAIGTLVPRIDVEFAVEEAATIFRAALENLPHRVAPELVGQGIDTIRATLRSEVQHILGELSRSFGTQMAQLGQRA